jgi:hypothetical protein
VEEKKAEVLEMNAITLECAARLTISIRGNLIKGKREMTRKPR